MKKVILILLAAIGLVSFTVLADKNFTIAGTAAGLENGKKIYLQKYDETKQGALITIDSAKIENGAFSFKGAATEPSIHFLEIEKVEGKLAFVLENGKINFTIYKDSIGKSKIAGTKNNEDLQKFNASAMKIQKKMIDFQTANTPKYQEAQQKNDTLVIGQLMNEMKVYQDQMTALSADFPEKNPKSYISVIIVDNMFNSPDVNIEKIKKLYGQFDAPLKNTKMGKLIQTKITNFKALTPGNMAPEFSAPNPEGKVVSLKETLGKVTIIDFWASWCGPCRRENPNVVALYNEYHSKGLNIIGVSLDKDADKWKEAIAKDNLTWTHVSNIKFWEDPIAVLYNIKSIPATFILDANGKIIARDLRGDELKAKISSILDK